MELWCQDFNGETSDSMLHIPDYHAGSPAVQSIKQEADTETEKEITDFEEQYLVQKAEHSDVEDEDDEDRVSERRQDHVLYGQSAAEKDQAVFPVQFSHKECEEEDKTRCLQEGAPEETSVQAAELEDQYDGDTDVESHPEMLIIRNSAQRKHRGGTTRSRGRSDRQGRQRQVSGKQDVPTKQLHTDSTDDVQTLPRRSKRKTRHSRKRQVSHVQWEDEDTDDHIPHLSIDFPPGLLVDDEGVSNAGEDTGHKARGRKKRSKSEPKHVNSKQLLFQCGVCDKTYPQGEKLRRHVLRSNHTNLVRCAKCSQTFSSPEELIVHVRQHAARPFHCDQCPATFTSSTHLRRHVQTHSGEKRYKCQLCPSAFHQLVNLKVHMRSHTGEKPYRCDQCPAAFTLSSNLKRHRRTHTGEKPYLCDVCNKAFSVSSQLKVHYRIHTGEKTYKCNQCPAAFIQSSSLKSHLNLHRGIKPYQCNLCPAAFVESTNLKVHMRTHSGEKPFLCEQCPRAFTQSSSLKKHRLIHTGERSFQCEHCPKTFRLPHGLKRHLVIHNENRHFRCSHCPAKFLKQEYLKAHMFLHNGEKPWLKKKQMAEDGLASVIEIDIDGQDSNLCDKDEEETSEEEEEEYDKDSAEEKVIG